MTTQQKLMLFLCQWASTKQCYSGRFSAHLPTTMYTGREKLIWKKLGLNPVNLAPKATTLTFSQLLLDLFLILDTCN